MTATGGDDVQAGTEGDRERLVPAQDGRDTTFAWVENALTRIEDPVANLPPTAVRVLNGAMHVVVTKGFGKLTLARISAASGENVAAVKYYFGNKAGLVSVLVDAVAYAELLLLTRPKRGGSGPSKHSRITEETLILSVPGKPLKVLFELLPYAVRDKKLRLQLQGYYETFYRLHLEQLGAGESCDPDVSARMSGLAMLLAAVSDGLTIQTLVSPRTFDVDELLSTLDILLANGIPALMNGEAQSIGAVGSSTGRAIVG